MRHHTPTASKTAVRRLATLIALSTEAIAISLWFAPISVMSLASGFGERRRSAVEREATMHVELG